MDVKAYKGIQAIATAVRRVKLYTRDDIDADLSRWLDEYRPDDEDGEGVQSDHSPPAKEPKFEPGQPFVERRNC